jgi:hypothetical protein
MQTCDCKEIEGPHHPSEHYAQQRDAWIAKVKDFMDRVYPDNIFVSINEHRRMIECITACFVLDEIEAKFYLTKKD